LIDETPIFFRGDIIEEMLGRRASEDISVDGIFIRNRGKFRQQHSNSQLVQSATYGRYISVRVEFAAFLDQIDGGFPMKQKRLRSPHEFINGAAIIREQNAQVFMDPGSFDVICQRSMSFQKRRPALFAVSAFTGTSAM
jgi:hypothetical protein